MIRRPSSFSKAAEWTAAARARVGQSLPTTSAIASNGRQLSAARLNSSAGISGSRAARSGRWSSHQRRARRASVCRGCVRSLRKRSTFSPMCLRRRRICTLRSSSVPGGSANQRNHDGGVRAKNSRFMVVAHGADDLPTEVVSRIQDREYVAPVPIGLSGPAERVIGPSNRTVGCTDSIVRKIAAPVMSAADKGLLTRHPIMSSSVVFPHRFSGDVMHSRGVQVKTSKT